LKSINTLFEDENFVVFDKPSKLLVIPNTRQEKNTLVDIVNRQCRVNTNDPKLYPCHRLDQETSGAIIFAKGKNNQRIMMDLFKEKKIRKKYIAFIHGKPSKRRGEIKRSITSFDKAKYNKKTIAKSALTQYKVLESRRAFSVLEVEPLTGRTNQIRIHFSKEGFPLLGERKYAFARDYHLKFRRVALHALSVSWVHPRTGDKINIKSKLPQDMKDFLLKNVDQRQ